MNQTKVKDLIFPVFLQYERDNGKTGIMYIKDKSELEDKLKRKDLYFPIAHGDE